MIIDKNFMRIRAIFLSGDGKDITTHGRYFTHENGDGRGHGDIEGYGQGYYTNTYAYDTGTGPGHEAYDSDLFKKGDGMGKALRNFTDF